MAEKAALTSHFLHFKKQEYKALKAEIETLQSEMYPSTELTRLSPK